MAEGRSEKHARPDTTAEATNFLKRMLSEQDTVRRAALSTVLEDEILIRIRQLREQISSQQVSRTEGVETLGSLALALSWIRGLVDPDTRPDSDDEPSCLRLHDAFLRDDAEAGVQYKIVSFPRELLFDLLVEDRCLSQENKVLFEEVIQSGHLDRFIPVKVNWQGDLLSLVNFVVLGYHLSLFKIHPKAPHSPKRTIPRRPVFESAIQNTFVVRGKKVYEGITSVHIAPLETEITKFLRDMRNRFNRAEHPAGYFDDLPEWLGHLYDKDFVAEIQADYRKLDFDMCTLLSRLLDDAE